MSNTKQGIFPESLDLGKMTFYFSKVKKVFDTSFFAFFGHIFYPILLLIHWISNFCTVIYKAMISAYRSIFKSQNPKQSNVRKGQNHSAPGWLLSSAYWGGNFFKIANIYLLSFTYGIIYWGSSFLWAGYYNALNGNSLATLGQVAIWVSIVGVVFSAAEQYLSNTLNMYANDQAFQQQTILTNEIRDKIGYLETAKNLSEQVVQSTLSYYTKLHNFCISCVLKTAGIIGNLIFLSRFALRAFTFKLLLCSVVINWVIYFVTSSNDNPESISHMKKNTDNASNDLRNSLADLSARRDDYAGNKNLRNWAVNRIRLNTKISRSLQRNLIVAKRTMEFIKSSLGRIVFPLIGIVVAWELKLIFPLAENMAVNRLVDVGLFIQIMQAYMSTWKDSVVFLDKQQDLSDAQSGFSNMTDLCDIYKTNPQSLRAVQEQKPMQSSLQLHTRQILFSIQPIFLTLSLLSFNGYGFANVFSSGFFLPWLASMSAVVAFTYLSSPRQSFSIQQNVDLSIFSMLSAFISTAGIMLLGNVLSHFVPLFSQISLFTATITAFSLFAILSHTVLHFSIKMSKKISFDTKQNARKNNSLNSSTPSFPEKSAHLKSLAALSADHRAIAYIEKKGSDSITAKNLALSIHEEGTLKTKWSLDGEMQFKAKESNLLLAPNSTGKSSTVKALCKDSQRSGEFFHGSVSLPGGHRMAYFPQSNNPLGRLPDFKNSFLDLPSGRVELKPLQLLFLRYAISDFSHPSLEDQRIWHRWSCIRKEIINFLETPDLGFDTGNRNGWISKLSEDSIDEGMSGGAVAKLNAAVVCALLSVYSDLEKDDSKYKAPFLSVIVDEAFNDVATKNITVLLKQLTDKVRQCSNTTLICILHTDNKEIISMYDRITLLQAHDKNTNGTKSKCKQINNADIDNYFSTHHYPVLTAQRF